MTLTASGQGQSRFEPEQRQGAGLPLLSETYLSGYSEQAVRESSIALDDPRLLDFLRFSAAYDHRRPGGMSERDGDRIFNTQIVVVPGQAAGEVSQGHAHG